MKGIIYSVMAVFLLLMPATPALAAIGDQPAEQWSLQGDIQAEKEIEGQMFSIFSLSSMATAPGAAAVSGPFGLLVVGAGAAGAGLARIASPENAIWENWPEGRYVFHHAPPDKFPGLGVLAEKALYSTVEFMANMIFSITKMLVRTSNNIMILAFHTSIITGMVGWVSEGMSEIFSSGSDLTQILISTGLIILLVYGIFSILRGRAMSALSSLLVAVLAVGGAFFFTANARQIISNTAEVTDSLAGVFLATTGRYTSAGQNVNIGDPVDRGLVAAGQTTWQLIVARPWALAQFGTSDENRLKLTLGEYDILNKSVFPKESQARIQTGMRLDTLILGSTGEGRDAIAEALARPNKKYLWVIDGQDIDHGGHDGTMVGFAPEGAMQHLKTAFFTLLPAVSLALLAILVGLSIVICQIILAPLLLFLPLPLFSMMIPGAGWAFAARYFRTLLGFFMVKLVYGLYLSLVLVTGTAFSAALIDHNLGAAMVVLAVIFFAAAIYRKKFLGLALESVQKGALRYHDSVSLDRVMSANATLARKLGLTDIFSDWAFSRRRGGKNHGGEPPPPADTVDAETVFFGSGPFRGRDGRNGGFKRDGGEREGYGKAWEGQPPRDYPFKVLPAGQAEVQGDNVTDNGGVSPGGKGQGGISDVTAAVPKIPDRAGSAAGARVGATAEASPAAGSGMALAVGAAAISGTKNLIKGEVEDTFKASGTGASGISGTGIPSRAEGDDGKLVSITSNGPGGVHHGRRTEPPAQSTVVCAAPVGAVNSRSDPTGVKFPAEEKKLFKPTGFGQKSSLDGPAPAELGTATRVSRGVADPPGKSIPVKKFPKKVNRPSESGRMKKPPYAPRSRLRSK